MTPPAGEWPYDVITFGDLCVDLIMTGGDIVPRFGQEEQLVGDYSVEMGGSCSIFACQAAKLGLRVGIVGRVGDDSFGRLILRTLEEAGVDTQHVIVDPVLKTGLGIALCNADDRAILTYMGTISALRPADAADDFLRAARHLHYGSFFLHTGLVEAVPDILRRARAYGLSISLDTNWDPGGRWDSTLFEALPLVDVFMPNEQEVTHITRIADPFDAVEHVRAQGVSIIALKLGAEGARLRHDGGVDECVVIPATGGDSVGAGDSFDAGFLAGWLRGMPLQTCLEIACACGRAVASTVGGVRGQPRWEDEAIQRIVERAHDRVN
jgi:sugar/nucleoside kinase (ribokinase family)